MDWYEVTGRYHEKTLAQDGRLASLPEEWQRELAALWRLEADVNNGCYLQFLTNWGRESYECAAEESAGPPRYDFYWQRAMSRWTVLTTRFSTPDWKGPWMPK